MFSLIISIIAIALAAVLLLTSAFYGGDALTEGTVKAEAAALANEAQQVAASYDLFKAERFGVAPTAVADLQTEGYLKQVPRGWTLVDVDANGSFDEVQEVGTVSDAVCTQVNENSALSGSDLRCDTVATDANTVAFPI